MPNSFELMKVIFPKCILNVKYILIEKCQISSYVSFSKNLSCFSIQIPG